MTLKNTEKGWVGLALLWAAIFIVLTLRVEAQTADANIHITWRAATYAPYEYPGKRLAIRSSQITAGVDIVQNGKRVGLSNQTVYWYVDDELVAAGLNRNRIIFRMPASLSKVEVRVEVPELGFLKTVTIPITSSRAVISAPVVAGQFQGESLLLVATPYFFNVQDGARLAYEWLVNGVPPDTSEESESLRISVNPGTPDGYPIQVSLGIRNPLISFEGAGARTDLVYRQ